MTSVLDDHDLLDPAVERRITALGVALTRWVDPSGTLLPARRACPCIYIVPPGSAPPPSWDHLSDWVRSPVESDELLARAESLAARATAGGLPGVVLDDDGVVHAAGRSIPLSDLQARMLRSLLDHADDLVDRQALIARTWPDGAPSDPRAIDNRVKLLRRRLHGVPVKIHAIRGRGFVLQHAPLEP
jgi:hypothetical protein